MRFLLANRRMSWCSARRAMFFRLKPSGPRTYLQIVENRRDDGAHRQHVIATLGRAGCVAKFAAGCEWPRYRADQAATWNSSATKLA